MAHGGEEGALGPGGGLSLILRLNQRLLRLLARRDVLHRADQSSRGAVFASDRLHDLGDPELFAAGTQHAILDLIGRLFLVEAARRFGHPGAIARIDEAFGSAREHRLGHRPVFSLAGGEQGLAGADDRPTLIVDVIDLQIGHLGRKLQPRLSAFKAAQGFDRFSDVVGRADDAGDLAGLIAPGRHFEVHPAAPAIARDRANSRVFNDLAGEAPLELVLEIVEGLGGDVRQQAADRRRLGDAHGLQPTRRGGQHPKSPIGHHRLDGRGSDKRRHHPAGRSQFPVTQGGDLYGARAVALVGDAVSQVL